MDLIDEQDIVCFERGENCCKVARAFQGRSRCDMQPGPHLGGDDSCKRRLPQPRWAREQQVIRGLTTFLSGAEHDREVFLQLALADEIGQRRRAKASLEHTLIIGRTRSRVDEVFTHGGPPRGSAHHATGALRRAIHRVHARYRESHRGRNRDRRALLAPGPRTTPIPPTTCHPTWAG